MSSHDSSDDDEEGQAFYAGGSERSGQQILGPPKSKRKNFGKRLTEMFRLAHESGAVVNLSDRPGTSSSRNDLYQGAGLRLGQTDDDHFVVSAAKKSENNGPIVLKLWNQGFSINDGELRPYEDPENTEFLETVMRGQIPNELKQMGNLVDIDLEDHRHEDFKSPPKKMTFKGSGHTLGNLEPKTEEVSAEPSSKSSNEENEKKAQEQVDLKTDEPSTMVQIRLADGSRISGRFNMSHTVDDIHRFIVTSRPQYESRTFILVTTFPTKELSDEKQTIKEAGLSNASLMQRLK